ncbi:MAG: LacI family transcriptional regulator [Lachnospiraceae bacterium]|jgi:LacI family purine nucleotide synthesis repressor|nr:LacI family transcriptional regulator [Lachnospiraceae bacterium]
MNRRKTLEKRVTIKDVAKEAGVSISTVSNALNNVNVLNPDTKERVLEVARRLNYTPNLNGRNLKAQATGVLGLFLGEIRGPYYGELSDSIYRACRESSYELEIFLSSDPRHIMTNILGHRVDGAVILNPAIEKEQEEILKSQGIPTVYIDRILVGEKSASVVFDSNTGGEKAAKFLLELGHKKFMFVEGATGNYDANERHKGFFKVLKNAGISIEDDYILKGEFDRKTSYDAITAFLDEGKELPDAIFAANDVSAIGVIEALRDNGVKVPEQVSVMGCDDIETTRMFKPTVTTIRTFFEKQGTIAVEQLIKMINGEPGALTTLDGRIIPRESTIAKE